MDTYNSSSFVPARSLDDDNTRLNEYHALMQAVESLELERDTLNLSISTFFDQEQNNLFLANEYISAFELYEKAEEVALMIERHNEVSKELFKLHDRLTQEFQITRPDKPQERYFNNAFSIYSSHAIGECQKVTSLKDFNVYEKQNKDFFVGKKIQDRIYELTYGCFSLTEAKEICMQMHNLKTKKYEQTLEEAAITNKLRSRTIELERTQFTP